MTSLTDWQSSTTAFTWTANGQLATQADANGVTQTNSYDAAGQTTSIVDASTAATLGTFGYSYDDAGQLVTDLGTFGLTSTGHDYAYDPLSQVTTVATSIDAGTPTSAAYAATSAGLLTANTAGATLAYNAAQQLSSVTPASGPATSFAYDGRGSRTSSTVAADGLTPARVTSYTYTASGALASVVTPTTTVGYTSNAQGLRQSRTVGSATQQFTWSSVGGLPLLLDDGNHSYIYGPSSTPIAQVDDSTSDVEYLHGDLLGSTRLISDDSAAVVGANTFDEYGNRTNHTGTADSAIGYTGNWTDPDTGLLYLRARDYDPATGQFLAVDPAVDATTQPYAYAGNDPLLNTDPTGLAPGDPEDVVGLVTASILSAASTSGALQLTSYMGHRAQGASAYESLVMAYDPIEGLLADYDHNRANGADPLSAGVMTFDPMYSVYDGFDRAGNDSKNGCSPGVVAGDYLQAGVGILSTIAIALGGAAGLSSRASATGGFTLRGFLADETGSAFGQNVPLTTQQATDLANRLGYSPTNYLSGKQRVFSNGEDFITQDFSAHVGGVWKGSPSPTDFSKQTRTGTYDHDMNWIAP